VVKNIAANFVVSENKEDMVQELHKLADTDNVGHEHLLRQRKRARLHHSLKKTVKPQVR
jgi:molecular chaperone DnaK (HSP70)